MRWLSERYGDPTKEWPAGPQELPAFDVWTMRLGTLSFGSAIESARFLGRPDLFRRRGRRAELLYAGRGFQIDFGPVGFCYLAFFIGEDAFVPDHPRLVFARPKVTGCEEGDVVLSSDTGAGEIIRIFGEADGEDTDDVEIILTYRRRGTILEFELNLDRRLKRWNLFPEAAS